MRYTASLLLLLLPGLLAWCQTPTPTLTGSPLQTHAAAGNLDSQIRSFGGAPYWVGYAVPTTPGEHHSCSSNWGGGGYTLEGRRTGTGAAAPTGPGRLYLEGAREMFILYRVEGQQIQKVRAVSPDCQLDSGGVAFHWLTGVSPSASVQLLTTLVKRDGEKPRTEALAAIAFHADPSAETALDQFVAPAEQSVQLRRDAAFWLIQRGTKSGFATVQRVAKEDRDDRVREHAIFSLSQSREPQAIPTIIEIAKTDRSAHVRGQALFWLAQKAGKQAEAAITDAIDRDPDTELKKKAVFALTQMPNGEGVPKLIEVARSNGNPAVRKQAMFWLGQSKDPRAVQFFEQVLR